jgi:hypothetical protein
MMLKNRNIRRAILFGIISLLYLMQSLSIFAATTVDSIPTPTGPYLVGYEKYDLNDPECREVTVWPCKKTLTMGGQT